MKRLYWLTCYFPVISPLMGLKYQDENEQRADLKTAHSQASEHILHKSPVKTLKMTRICKIYLKFCPNHHKLFSKVFTEEVSTVAFTAITLGESCLKFCRHFLDQHPNIIMYLHIHQHLRWPMNENESKELREAPFNHNMIVHVAKPVHQCAKSNLPLTIDTQQQADLNSRAELINNDP